METIISLSNDFEAQYAVFPNQSSFTDAVKPHVTTLEVFEYSWWSSPILWTLPLKIKMLKGFYKAAIKISEFIKENYIDLVITHSIVNPAGALGAAKAKCRHIWYLHEYGDIDHQLFFNYGKQFSMRMINRLSSDIIVNSKALRHYFNSYFPAEKINLVYYAVDVNKRLSATLLKPESSLKICMTGRVTTGKNQITALKALSHLKQEGISPVISFVGNFYQPYLESLQEYITVEELQNQVSFTGQQPDPIEFVKQSDCVLVCSLDEAFGRVTIEGMKAGKVPVIANTGAGAELITDGETGFLFAPLDFESLANIFKRLWKMTDISDITTEAQTVAYSLCNRERHRADILKVILN